MLKDQLSCWTVISWQTTIVACLMYFNLYEDSQKFKSILIFERIKVDCRTILFREAHV